MLGGPNRSEVSMAEVFTRFLDTLTLRREAFVWMDLNDRATGDALILVALTPVVQVLLFVLGLGSLVTIGAWSFLLNSVIAALIQWLLYSGIAWAIVRYGIKAGADFATYLRFTGFAYPTTLLVVLVALVLGRLGFFTLLLGFAWFIVIIARGIEYSSDLPRSQALLIAVGALIGLMIVNTIFSLSPLA